MESDLGDSNSRVVGAKQLVKALKEDTVKVIYVAMDAQPHVIHPILEMAGDKVQVVQIPTMQQLGEACGIQVGAAVAGILK